MAQHPAARNHQNTEPRKLTYGRKLPHKDHIRKQYRTKEKQRAMNHSAESEALLTSLT
jgi:hypothetical protein